MTKIQKSNESENRQVPFTCQLCKSRRTKTRQSNYKIWQIWETTKQPVKLAYHLVNLKKKQTVKCMHYIVILRVELCLLFRLNKAINKSIWFTCFKQFLSNRLFIHNMLHHVVILRVEPCCFFPSLPLFIFLFLKRKQLCNTEAQNLTTNFKNLNKYRV